MNKIKSNSPRDKTTKTIKQNKWSNPLFRERVFQRIGRNNYSKFVFKHYIIKQKGKIKEK